MILEEFDANQTAVINPTMIVPRIEGMPKVAVTCYSHVTFERLVAETKAEKIAETSDANMKIPVYETVYQGTKVALFMSAVGAAASVAVLEDLYAMGVEKIIVFGTCGVLDSSIENCAVIIPDAAVRDEGTSFHYAMSSDEIAVNQKYLEDFKALLEELHCEYTVGKVWTTDGIYRETKEKVARRKAAGCICVDMECSANTAVSNFRGKELFQFFYAADNLDAEEWDKRGLGNHENLLEKDKIAMLALEFAVRIEKEEDSMDELVLVEPEIGWEEEISAVKQEISASTDADKFAGCGGLNHAESVEAWITKIRPYESEATCPPGKVPSTIRLAVRTRDKKVVGIIDLRHNLNNPVLRLWGGHIGYSVRPSERRKGYAKEMLGLMLEEARKRGLEKVMVSCSTENEASERTILANGGVYEKTVSVENEQVKRYWITL